MGETIKSKLVAGGISFIDKLILAFALVLVAFDSITVNDGWNILFVILVVLIVYLIVIGFVNIATMGVVTNDGCTRTALGILVAGFVFWLYPMLLEIAFFFMGLELSVDVKTVLLWTLVIRSFVRFVLNKKWGHIQ